MTELTLKTIGKSAVPAALQKAERYRLLNEPGQAESICLDVLRVDAENGVAWVSLLLALTDQLGTRPGVLREARDILPKLQTEYERAYYAGVISERQALADLKRGGAGSSFSAYEELHEAMAFYERAEKLRSDGNDEALLRWNTCARLLMRDSSLRPRPQEAWDHPHD